MVQAAQPPRRDETKSATSTFRTSEKRRGLSDERMEELRALIARRAPLLKELEKH